MKRPADSSKQPHRDTQTHSQIQTNVKTSSHFISIFARGTDWRDTSKNFLEELQKLRTDGDGLTLGFLYITDHLAQDAGSILNLCRSVTNIPHWAGCISAGVSAGDGFAFDDVAIAGLICKIPAQDFIVLPGTSQLTSDIGDQQIDQSGDEQDERVVKLQKWLSSNNGFCMIAHGDPMSKTDPSQDLLHLNALTNGFIVGGLATSHHNHLHFADDILSDGISGVLFNEKHSILTGLTQGCSPMGPLREVTKAHGNLILQLDGENAYERFVDDIREFAHQNAPNQDAPNQDAPNQDHTSNHTQDHSDAQAAEEDPLKGIEIEFDKMLAPVKALLEQEIHVAMPIDGSDVNDYLVRGLIGLDDQKGAVAIAQNVKEGDRIMLVRRDPESMEQDLSRMLLSLRKRFAQEYGEQPPKAGVYISCIARSDSPLAQPYCPHDIALSPQLIEEAQSALDSDDIASVPRELALIKEIIGDIPLVSYYASGEISNAQLYGYTGILILFG